MKFSYLFFVLGHTKRYQHLTLKPGSEPIIRRRQILCLPHEKVLWRESTHDFKSLNSLHSLRSFQ